jgi:hypothetical protein
MQMSSAVLAKFERYPESIKGSILALRELVLLVAKEDNLGPVQESLKWGELTYATQHGSPLRLDWKPKRPDKYAMYFHCQTRLVETFRELYPDLFEYDKNRAILFAIEQPLPIEALKHCISLCLRYHKIKTLPLLGA